MEARAQASEGRQVTLNRCGLTVTLHGKRISPIFLRMPKVKKSKKLVRWSRHALKKHVSKAYGTYAIVGKTRDGVTILRPKVQSKKFSSKQIRQTIHELEKSAG